MKFYSSSVRFTCLDFFFVSVFVTHKTCKVRPDHRPSIQQFCCCLCTTSYLLAYFADSYSLKMRFIHIRMKEYESVLLFLVVITLCWRRRRKNSKHTKYFIYDYLHLSVNKLHSHFKFFGFALLQCNASLMQRITLNQVFFIYITESNCFKFGIQLLFVLHVLLWY